MKVTITSVSKRKMLRALERVHPSGPTRLRTIAFSEEELQRIERLCDATGMTVEMAIRDMVLMWETMGTYQLKKELERRAAAPRLNYGGSPLGLPPPAPLPPKVSVVQGNGFSFS